MEEDSASAADIPGEEKQFTVTFMDPDDVLRIHVPEQVPVKIGDQVIGIARTKQTPDGTEFETEVDWTETKRKWVNDALVGLSFDYERPLPEPSIVRPYVHRFPFPPVIEERRIGGLNTGLALPIVQQIPSRNGGDMLNPDPFSAFEVKPGTPRPEPDPEQDTTKDTDSGD
jgi:hypothetical protein